MNDVIPVVVDLDDDLVTVYGIKYSLEMFRYMAFAPTGERKWMRIVNRDDGVITVEVRTTEKIIEEEKKS